MTRYQTTSFLIALAVIGIRSWFDHRRYSKLIKEIKHMSTVLAALQQVDSDLASQVQQNTSDTATLIADVQDLTQKLSDATSGQIDPAAVAPIVADLQSKVAALKTSHDAVSALLNPPAPVSTDPAPTDPATDPAPSTDPAPVDPNAPVV